MPTASFGNNYGAGLSELDVQCLSEFVRGLAVNHIIPNLEMRVRALNHQVSNLQYQHNSDYWVNNLYSSRTIGLFIDAVHLPCGQLTLGGSTI